MEHCNIAIVGAGPAGIASAVEAKTAGISSVVIFEKARHLNDTIVTLYHEGKRVDPVYRKVKIDPIGKLSFDTETKEEFIKRMEEVSSAHSLDVRLKSEVTKVITQADGSFKLVTGAGSEVVAQVVIVAIGVFGKPVKPSYPISAELKDRVLFSLPKTPIEGSSVLVVGGGDTAAEVACFLCEKNDVSLSYRRAEFFRLNDINACNLKRCSCKNKINVMLSTDIDHLSRDTAGEKIAVLFKDGRTMSYDYVLYCLGGSTPQAFLEAAGVEFNGKMAVADSAGETNVQRLFLAGDLAVEKGSIMAAFNSAKRTVDAVKERYGQLFR